MDEGRLTSLLVAASDEIARSPFEPEDDLRRGRSVRRRRRTLATAAAALGAAAVVAVAFALSGSVLGRTTGTEAPSGGGTSKVEASTTATAQASTAATTAPTTATTTARPTSETSTMPPDPFGLPTGARDFLRMVFGVAQDHLDPAHQRLQWSEGFTGGGGANTREWGQKFGWQAANDPGQAMVYAAVGDKAVAYQLGCGQYDYRGSAKCTTATMSNGQKVQVLNTGTRREVHWTRPDGSYVFVIVDAVFGNNTYVATKSALPTLAQLEDFVMDPRLVLPPA